MKKISLLIIALAAGCSLPVAAASGCAPEPAAQAAAGKGGLIAKLVHFIQNPPVVPVAAAPCAAPNATPCATTTPHPLHTQPVVIPAKLPVLITPTTTGANAPTTTVTSSPANAVYDPYRGWVSPPERPRRYYPKPAAPYPGPYCRPALR